MKNQIKIIALISCILLNAKIAIAQFNPNGIPTSVYLQPTYPGFGGNDQLSVGIGNFSTPNLFPGYY